MQRRPAATARASDNVAAVSLPHLHLEKVGLAGAAFAESSEEAGVADAEAVVDAELVPPVPERRAGPANVPGAVLQVHGPRLAAHPQLHLAPLRVPMRVLELHRHVLHTPAMSGERRMQSVTHLTSNARA